MSTLTDLAAAPFVSLTTFRRSGAAIATPLWVVAGDASALFWTPRDTGKVKRLRNNPTVELRPCDRRGRVAPDAPVVVGVADISDDPDALRDVTDGLRRKYGLQFRAVTLLEKLRPKMADRVVLTIRDTPA